MDHEQYVGRLDHEQTIHLLRVVIDSLSDTDLIEVLKTQLDDTAKAELVASLDT